MFQSCTGEAPIELFRGVQDIRHGGWISIEISFANRMEGAPGEVGGFRRPGHGDCVGDPHTEAREEPGGIRNTASVPNWSTMATAAWIQMPVSRTVPPSASQNSAISLRSRFRPAGRISSHPQRLSHMLTVMSGGGSDTYGAMLRIANGLMFRNRASKSAR